MEAEPKSTTSRQRQHRTRPPAELPALLAEGLSIRAIADKLQADRVSVTAWAKRPDVKAEVANLQRAASEAALRRIHALQAPAIEALAETVKADGACSACGRSGAEPRDRVRAAEAILDRTGLPKRQETVLSGGVGLSVSLDDRSDAELEADILSEAAAILEERGDIVTAKKLRAAAAKGSR